jgi:hypothetical protein
VVVSCFVHRTQRGAKDWSATQERAGTNVDKRYFCHPSFSCVSLDGFERKSVSMLSIFCLELRSSSRGDLPVRREIFLQSSFPIPP